MAHAGARLAAPRRAARLSAAACGLMAVALPLAAVWQVLQPWPQALLGQVDRLGLDTAALSADPRRLGLLAVLALLPVSSMAAALWEARRCFARLAVERFTPAVARHLRGFARWSFLAAVAGALVPSLAGLLATWHAGGSPSLVLRLDSHQALLLLFSALAWQLAALLAEAAVMAEDHALIV